MIPWTGATIEHVAGTMVIAEGVADVATIASRELALDMVEDQTDTTQHWDGNTLAD